MNAILRDAPHLATIARPVDEHEWQVCANRDGSLDETQTVFGYISELGGIYEVHVLRAPGIRQYVTTFKEAMDCFGVVS